MSPLSSESYLSGCFAAAAAAAAAVRSISKCDVIGAWLMYRMKREKDSAKVETWITESNAASSAICSSFIEKC
jgi:hypothetical protein